MQTEFERKQPNLSHYCSSTRYALANVRTQSRPSNLWPEDAHLLVYSMLQCLYITVLQTDGLSTMKQAAVDTFADGGRPRVPPSAERHECMLQHPMQLNKMYAFRGIWSWPARESVVFQDSPSHAHAPLYIYADVQKAGSPETTHTADKWPAIRFHNP